MRRKRLVAIILNGGMCAAAVYWVRDDPQGVGNVYQFVVWVCFCMALTVFLVRKRLKNIPERPFGGWFYACSDVGQAIVVVSAGHVLLATALVLTALLETAVFMFEEEK